VARKTVTEISKEFWKDVKRAFPNGLYNTMSANDQSPIHYRQEAIQVWDFIIANEIPYMEGNIIKYICRWREKGGLEDLQKAKHYIEKLMETVKPTSTIADSVSGEERRTVYKRKEDEPLTGHTYNLMNQCSYSNCKRNGGNISHMDHVPGLR